MQDNSQKLFLSNIRGRDIKTLKRRLNYLEELKWAGDANSWDLREITTLQRVITFLEATFGDRDRDDVSGLDEP